MPHCKECCREAERKRNASNPDRMRNANLKRFGLTIDSYTELWDLQEGLCAICFRPEEGRSNRGKERRLSVDHDHETNEVRGLLCTKCNTFLGLADDDIDRLQAAIRYLKKWKTEHYED